MTSKDSHLTHKHAYHSRSMTPTFHSLLGIERLCDVQFRWSSGILLKSRVYFPPLTVLHRIQDQEKKTVKNLRYILSLFCLCRYNSTIHHFFERKTKNSANMVNGLASNTEMDDNSNCDATVVLLKKGNCSSKSPCHLHHSGFSLLTAHTVGVAALL